MRRDVPILGAEASANAFMPYAPKAIGVANVGEKASHAVCMALFRKTLAGVMSAMITQEQRFDE